PAPFPRTCYAAHRRSVRGGLASAGVPPTATAPASALGICLGSASVTSALRCLIVGGAGVIGSHFVARLVATPQARDLIVYDNFSAGREWHLAHHDESTKLGIVRADVKDLDSLVSAMRGAELVIHLASNPDIARAASEPAIDFHEGTYLTHNVLEAMR